MGGIFVIKEIWSNYFFMKHTSLWHFHFCPSHNLYNVFFLMSFFLAEKHINKNSVKKKIKWRWGDYECYVTSDFKWKKKYRFHISSWRENGNLKIMFTNFPFVPSVNQGFLCLINLPFIQLKNCSFIENNDYSNTKWSSVTSLSFAMLDLMKTCNVEELHHWFFPFRTIRSIWIK